MGDPQQLADGVVRLGTQYVNWYLVADKGGVVIVDSGVPGYRPQLEPGLDLLGRSLDDVRAVLLTHGDADHFGGAGKLHRQRPEIPVHLHPSDDELVRGARKKTEDSPLPTLFKPQAWRFLAHFVRNGAINPQHINETVPLVDGATLEVPGAPTVIHTPGHTNGHVVFHFAEQGVLIAGDTICTWNPVSGVRGPQIMRPAFNVSNQQALDSLSRFENLEADFVLVGHGEPWTEGPAAAVERAHAADAGLTRV